MSTKGNTFPPSRDHRTETTPGPVAPTADQLPGLVSAAERALEVTGDAEGKNIYAPQLVAALRPLLLVPAVGVRCGRPTCSNRLGWWALYPGTAIVVATDQRVPKGRRTGGIGDLDRRNEKPGAFPFWVSQAEDGTGPVTVSEKVGGTLNTSGYPLRLTLTCACRTEKGKPMTYITTNTSRLRRMLAILREQPAATRRIVMLD